MAELCRDFRAGFEKSDARKRPKSAGRNAFRFFTATMTDSANDRLQLETDLRSALIKEQFELHYQPQVSPVDGRIVGVEALLRKGFLP